LRRKVAGEIPRVEIDEPDDTAQTQPDDRCIVTAAASATRFPAVHPLAMRIERARARHGLGATQHAFLGGEEFVGDPENFGAELAFRQVDESAGNLAAHRCRRAHLAEPLEV